MSSDFVLLTAEARVHTPAAASGRVSLSTPKSYARSRRFGFTLVELLIATVVLAVGLVALTSAGAASVKLESRGQRLGGIAAAAETRLELLRAAGCASTADRSRSGWLDERWSVTQTLERAAVVVDSVLQGASQGDEPSELYVFRSAVRC